ncbi:MAG TPA: hypothetical protein VN238_06505 [Solirubrobacteraceae bacterium]|nr:hypothetical protein [Solirubrobacteraceae bacterium]
MGDEHEDDTHAKAAEEMRELEQADEIPQDPTDWPGGKAKYVTFGARATSRTARDRRRSSGRRR